MAPGPNGSRAETVSGGTDGAMLKGFSACAARLRQRYASPRDLERFGIMGMNQRNVSYIGRYNPRRLYPLVDNKLLTKEIALRSRVRTPLLIGCIRSQHEVRNFLSIIGEARSFCIKPACGSGGKGILIISGREGRTFIKASGQELREQDIHRHLSNILAGLFSLGGKQDMALVEDLISFDDSFEGFSYEGVPDTRVIVFQGFPVMSMMRLSTRASDGKANLHQGAVGVGICIRTGRAVRAVQHNVPVSFHPDTNRELSELSVPRWHEVLALASACHHMTGLGYIGTDIVLDRFHGPMLLELNARPGLAIQTANNAGLLPRLRLIEALPGRDAMSTEHKVAFAMQHFGVFSP